MKQSNFHDYPVLRMSEMPRVEVYIVASADDPHGVGEPAVPPLAPAVANALAMATGKPVRRLPLALGVEPPSSKPWLAGAGACPHGP